MVEHACIGLIGCGNMGEAIARGIRSDDTVSRNMFYVFDIDSDRAQFINNSYGASVCGSAEEVLRACGIVIIAVKPQDMDDFLQLISQATDPSKLIISVAAGVTISSIKAWLKDGVRVARVMPNMPALIGAGMSALSFGDMMTEDDKMMVREIFAKLGEVIDVQEDLMDAVTALSGSGPAYYFYITELITAMAVKCGMDKETARKLAAQTALGSARIVKESKEDCAALRARVTSKGGTTEAAFKVLNEAGFGDAFRRAINAAVERSKELRGGK